jgi:type VI secretion system protein ImpA
VLSRDQALRALDKVCAYLERAEPTNPAPLLIRRAQRLMSMSFLEIMRDMAPDALGPVHNIAGVREGEPENN